MVQVRYEIVVTNAFIWAYAIAVLAASFANRLAEALISKREAVVALAVIWHRTRAVGARWGAEGYTNTVRVPHVTVIANTNAGLVACSLNPARGLVTARSWETITNAR